MNTELPPFKNGEHNSESVHHRPCHNPFNEIYCWIYHYEVEINSSESVYATKKPRGGVKVTQHADKPWGNPQRGCHPHPAEENEKFSPTAGNHLDSPHTLTADLSYTPNPTQTTHIIHQTSCWNQDKYQTFQPQNKP